MEQRKSPSDSRPGVAAQPPSWMHRATPYAPERRAKMLEHMARARSQPQRQAAPKPSRANGIEILSDIIGHIVLFGLIAILFMSRIPLYVGAFLFFTDGERIERMLAATGIRFEPGAIGPDIVKGFATWFGWFALLGALKGSVPALVARWMPPAESWSVIAGIALLFACLEVFGSFAIRRALAWFGLEHPSDGLIWTTIKFLIGLGLLVLVVLLG
ncbi:putative membrane protein YagU involved in acid resistance [Bradyrhizobium sp. USDA 377]